MLFVYQNRFQRNPSPETPLFVDLTGAAVTRAKFLSLFKHALVSLGVDSYITVAILFA